MNVRCFRQPWKQQEGGERMGRRNGGGGDANAEVMLQDAIREGSHAISVATVRSEYRICSVST